MADDETCPASRRVMWMRGDEVNEETDPHIIASPQRLPICLITRVEAATYCSLSALVDVRSCPTHVI